MISRDKAPTAQETLMQMMQAAGLRGRLFVTVGILILVRLGIFYQSQALIAPNLLKL